MATTKRNIRGLQDIPTLSGRVDQTALPYKAYMKVACLEMEKVRRGKERESASFRVKNIDARFKEIEDEKAALLQALAKLDKPGSGAFSGCSEKGPDPLSATKGSDPFSQRREKASDPTRSASGLRLRY